MMQEQSQPSTVPADIESPSAKLVYYFLSTHGEATIGELQECLDMKKITLYSILETLKKRGFVDGDAETFVALGIAR